MFNLNSFPLSISYAFHYKLRILFLVRESDSFIWYITIVKYSPIFVLKSFGVGISLGMKARCWENLSATPHRATQQLAFPPKSAVTIWPEFLWGTKKHKETQHWWNVGNPAL